MGAIRDSSSGAIRILEPSHVVGRGPPPKCSLTLNHPYVSTVHAELRWTGADWELKDLGSRNGTFLDGRRLDASVPTRLEKGSKVAFGGPEQTWELVDASGPPIMVVPLGGGDPVLLRDDFIALPSSDDPRAMIYRSPDGAWRLESGNAAPRSLVDLETFEAVGGLWRFSCADLPPATVAVPDAGKLRFEVRDLQLRFSVSRDEEHVRLEMSRPGHDVDMGSRKHNYLLLTLARHRLEEEVQGVPATSCGWIDQEELAHDPSMKPPQLNIDVFRIREQFAKAGVVDAAGIIERRSGQLRVGPVRVTITTL